ncbi:hypothetical protein [Deefgea rivuli]|uniref:hypothetical protein n=1 Tax=Deefgea rivuli TaxID=400948 RepID=UPI0004823D41|nr:hypothetical protein [Deefgea rivuli]
MAIDTESIALAAKIALNPAGFLIDKIVEATSKNVSKAESTSSDEIAVLKIEAERQELQMRMAEAQARVAQEIAIAKRIETAKEVEMEEFYDYGIEAHVGVKVDSGSVSAGVGGSGRRVSKRIFRFRGNTSVAIDAE